MTDSFYFKRIGTNDIGSGVYVSVAGLLMVWKTQLLITVFMLIHRRAGRGDPNLGGMTILLSLLSRRLSKTRL